jgi:hypothetical protein
MSSLRLITSRRTPRSACARSRAVPLDPSVVIKIPTSAPTSSTMPTNDSTSLTSIGVPHRLRSRKRVASAMPNIRPRTSTSTWRHLPLRRPCSREHRRATPVRVLHVLWERNRGARPSGPYECRRSRKAASRDQVKPAVRADRDGLPHTFRRGSHQRLPWHCRDSDGRRFHHHCGTQAGHHRDQPTIGVPLDPAKSACSGILTTTDLGVIVSGRRLRLRGRANDQQIAGLWPRDTLDAFGPHLGRRCTLIRPLGTISGGD